MKKLKTIFSPRKLVLWLSIVILIFTLPQLNAKAMSQTEAIVTMMFVDKEADTIKVSAVVLAPGQDKTKNQQVYNGEGDTLSAAVDSVSLSLGKDMGFAQCQIMGLGDNICKDGVINVLDYMTRTKKVGRNAGLINFSGKIDEFAQATADVNTSKNLSLEEIINFDKRFILAKNSNIELFYMGYFGDTGIGVIPKIELLDAPYKNSVEVGQSGGESAGAGSSSSGGGQGQSKPKYLFYDGTMNVFKFGKSVNTIKPTMVDKLNYFVEKNQTGSVVVDGVSDYLYNNARVVVNIAQKDTFTFVSFKDSKPRMDVKVNLSVMVEEVDEDNPTKKILRRNQEFLTPELVKKMKEKVEADMHEGFSYCQQNKIDVIGVYKHFNAFAYKQWKNHIKQLGEDNFLDDIDLNISVIVKSEF